MVTKSDNDETDPYSKTEIRFVMDRNINEQLTLGATALYSEEEIDYDGLNHEFDHIDRTRSAGSIFASFESGSITNKIKRVIYHSVNVDTTDIHIYCA